MSVTQPLSVVSPAAPIGLFDSGWGGLTVLRELRGLMPQEAVHYLADTAYAPYGSRSYAQIRRRSELIAGELFDSGCKALVIACNTATAAAVEHLRQRWPTRIIVAMEPGVKPAITSSPAGVVGVLATEATLASPRYAKLLERYSEGGKVVSQACPGLVERIECGAWASAETEQLLRGYLQPLLSAGADRVVLGCTHYPFLRPLIERLCGPHVEVVETGAAVAQELRRRLLAAGLALGEGGPAGALRLATTADPAHVAPIAAQLWGTALPVHPCTLPDEGV